MSRHVFPTQNVSFPCGDLDLIQYMIPLAHPSPQHGISIGSAIFAKLMADFRRAYPFP